MLINQMPEIDELLATDHANVPETKKLLAAFHPELQRALNLGASIYSALARAIPDSDRESTDVRAYREAARALGAKDREELDHILGKKAKTKAERKLRVALKAAEDRRKARRARIIVLLMMYRAYMWAVTDVLRMRMTPAIGYGRQLAEGFALLALMHRSPGAATRWLRILTNEHGERFYKRHQGELKHEMRHADLLGTYERGSGAALHVRFAAAARGLHISSSHDDSRVIDEIKLVFQEVQKGNEGHFIDGILGLLRTQERVFTHLGSVLPEVEDPLPLKKLAPEFRKLVDALVETLRRHVTQAVRRGSRPARS
jgi:hypothetical protein